MHLFIQGHFWQSLLGHLEIYWNFRRILSHPKCDIQLCAGVKMSVFFCSVHNSANVDFCWVMLILTLYVVEDFDDLAHITMYFFLRQMMSSYICHKFPNTA